MKLRSAILMILMLFAACYCVQAQEPIYTVDLTAATSNDKLVALSVQGLVNRNTSGPSVYTIFSSQDDNWLGWALGFRSGSIEALSAKELLDKFRHLVKGQILCEPADSISLNAATSLAGMHDAVLTSQDLGLPTIYDLRQKFKSPTELYTWITKKEEYKWSQNGIVMLGVALPFRDYIISKKMLVLPMPEITDKQGWSVLNRLVGSYPVGAPLFGPSPERIHDAVGTWATRSGHPLLSIEYASNLSFHSQLKATPFRQRRQMIEMEPSVHVCFIFSGGNDFSYLMNRMPELWESPTRRNLPLGWAIPADIGEIAPDLLQFYAAEAYNSGNDTFVFQVDQLGASRIGAYRRLDAAGRKNNINTLLVMDNTPQQGLSIALDSLVESYQPHGIFLPDRKDISSQMTAETVLVAIGFSSSSPQEILDRLTSLKSKKAGLIFVVVDAKSITPDDIDNVVALLPEYFKIIGPEEFVSLAKHLLTGEKEEIPSKAVVRMKAPEYIEADKAFQVKAQLVGQMTKEATLIYRQEGDAPLAETMRQEPDGSFAATVGPLLRGGKWLFQAKMVDTEDKTTTSQAIEVQVPVVDEDKDGLHTAEEELLTTQRDRSDSDGDGLLDGFDEMPLALDASPGIYFGPLRAMDDAPYLVVNHGSYIAKGKREIRGENYCIYRFLLEALPPQTPAVLALKADQEAKVSFSLNGKDFGPRLKTERVRQWQVTKLPDKAIGQRAFYVAVLPADSEAGLSLEEIAIVSSLEAPSISLVVLSPVHPGAGLPVTVSAKIWSPVGIAEAFCVYRAGGRDIKLPLTQVANSPVWMRWLGSFDNSTRLDWWIVAKDTKGNKAASRVKHTWIGTFMGEAIVLDAGEELKGGWEPVESCWGVTLEAREQGVRDRGVISVAGNQYEIWALAGGRGREVGVWIDGNYFAGIKSDKPDGWQLLGKMRLSAGEHKIEIVSGTGDEGISAVYSQLLFTSSSSFRPPPQGALMMGEALYLFRPQPGDIVGENTRISASAAGNIALVEFYVDNKLLRRFTNPPYSFDWDTGRLSEGNHILRMVGIGRNKQPVVFIEVEVDRREEAVEAERR